MVLHSTQKLTLVVLTTVFVVRAADPLPDPWRHALDSITTSSLRGHVSFLASDLLEGRATPSPGLDVAAEYIAAQFRRAGLEPKGDNDYFQTAKFAVREATQEGAELTIRGKAGVVRLSANQLAARCLAPLDISDSAVVKAARRTLPKLDTDQVKGKVLIVEDVDSGRSDPQRVLRQVSEEARRLEPALVLVPVRDKPALDAMRRPELFDPEGATSNGSSVIVLSSNDVANLIDKKDGLTISGHCREASQKAVPLRNVVGLLRGSDPSLADTVVMISAHYDHVGMKESGEGDRIFNGANDDASGTTAVVEIANALAGLSQKPKRSILFVAFFGEEHGMLGSRYYARHPVVPIDKTVADINIEQVGRPWPVDKSGRLRASVTGFDYSDVVKSMERAANFADVELYKNGNNDGRFFFASDNISLAEKGVPAHTVCTAFDFPDYHQPGDQWEKLDYESMTRVTRMIALTALLVADSVQPPVWNEKESKTEKFRKAR